MIAHIIHITEKTQCRENGATSLLKAVVAVQCFASWQGRMKEFSKDTNFNLLSM